MTDGNDEHDEVLASYLALGWSFARAARKLGVHERTVRRRLENPGFRELVNRFRREAIGTAIGKVSAAASEAVTALRRLMRSKHDGIKLGAARTILDCVMRVHATMELEDQLAQVTRDIEAIKKARR